MGILIREYLPRIAHAEGIIKCKGVQLILYVYTVLVAQYESVQLG